MFEYNNSENCYDKDTVVGANLRKHLSEIHNAVSLTGDVNFCYLSQLCKFYKDKIIIVNCCIPPPDSCAVYAHDVKSTMEKNNTFNVSSLVKQNNILFKKLKALLTSIKLKLPKSNITTLKTFCLVNFSLKKIYPKKIESITPKALLKTSKIGTRLKLSAIN